MEDINSCLSHIDNILNIDNSKPAPSTSTKQTGAKKKTIGKENRFAIDRFKNMSEEEFDAICYRALILYKTGVYFPPEKDYTCKNKKKRKPTGPKVYDPDLRKKKTTFGSGRVGVSCESYGVKKCSCCRPDYALPYLQPELQLQNLYKQLETQIIQSDSEATEDDDLLIVDIAKKMPDSIIDISDDSIHDTPTNKNVSTINISDVVVDYVDLESDNLQKYEDINIKTEKNIDSNSNILNSAIKTEIIEPKAPNTNNNNILEYIDLVTDEFDENSQIMKDYEDNFMALITKEMESTAVQDTTFSIPNNQEVQSTSTPNTEVKKRTSATKDVNNSNKKIENAEHLNSLVVSKNNSPKETRNGFECPICLETLKGKEIMSTICGHIFCAGCIQESIKKTKKCPKCRRALTLKRIHPIYLG